MKYAVMADSYRLFMKKAGALFLIASLTTSLTGCVTFLTEVKVRGDGSGTMVQTMTMSPEQMKETTEKIAQQMGATTSGPEVEPKKDSGRSSAESPFKEGDLKGKAADFGEGVRFVSVEEIDTKTAAGFRVTYAFKDINKLAFNPKPQAAVGTAAAGASSQDALKFRFSHKSNGNAVLTVVLAQPRSEAEGGKADPPRPSPVSSAEEAQQAELIKYMFKGLHMGIAVEVEGKVVWTNSAYVEGSKVTLMDIDFDLLLSDQGKLKALSEKMETTMGDDRKTLEALKEIKGLKITTDPEISIEFTPK